MSVDVKKFREDLIKMVEDIGMIKKEIAATRERLKPYLKQQENTHDHTGRSGDFEGLHG